MGYNTRIMEKVNAGTGMRVLVTGGAGYIGSHFLRHARAAGMEPVVLDNLSTGHRWAVPPDVPFYEAGMAETGKVIQIMRDEGIEALAHFAGSILVGESVKDPSKYLRNNYVGTLALLEAMREAGVRDIVFSSSCAVYGLPPEAPINGVPIREDMPKRPINPYGLTKYFAEQSIKSYEKAYGLRHVSLRYFNAAGAEAGLETGEMHEPETHLIPLVLEAALGLRPHIEVYGTDYPTPDGTCVRDYVDVNDLAEAHLLAIKHLARGGESAALNLGSGRGVSVREVIEAARRVTGKAIEALESGRREGDSPVLVADISLARDLIGWEPAQGDMDAMINGAWQWTRSAIKRGIYRAG